MPTIDSSEMVSNLTSIHSPNWHPLNTSTYTQLSAAAITSTSTLDLKYKKLVNCVHSILSSIIVLVGVIGNTVSFFVFLRSGRHKPRIVTRNLLLLLTITNMFYLLFFWFHVVFPKLIEKQINSQQYNFISSRNFYTCKLLTYAINVTVCLNATVTVSFSVERAIAINFPFETRNLRENYRGFFNYLIIFIIFISFVVPIYHAILVDIVPMNQPDKTKCDVPKDNENLYWYLTVVFVINTLVIPFFLITISNISVLCAISKNNKSITFNIRTASFSENLVQPSTAAALQAAAAATVIPDPATAASPQSAPTASTTATATANANGTTKASITNCESSRMLIPRDAQSQLGTATTSSGRHNSSVKYKFSRSRQTKMSVLSTCSYAKKPNDKNSKITTMLLAISASFVLLNLPHFIAWTIYAYNRVFNENKSAQKIHVNFLILRLTELLVLLNYSINGFLYFSTGKLYREHLYYLFGCKYTKTS